jgi:hypothetical protein
MALVSSVANWHRAPEQFERNAFQLSEENYLHGEEMDLTEPDEINVESFELADERNGV